MKSKHALMSMMAMAAMMSSESVIDVRNRGRKFEPDLTPKKTIIPKGCKEYEFPNGIKIIALNESSAKRKYSKMIKS